MNRLALFTDFDPFPNITNQNQLKLLKTRAVVFKLFIKLTQSTRRIIILNP